MGNILNSIATKQEKKNGELAPIGYISLLTGINFLSDCKMVHSGRIPIMSCKAGFEEFEIVNDYFSSIDQGLPIIDAIKHSIGSRKLRNIFRDSDINKAIDITIELYLTISEQITNDDDCTRLE